MKEENNNYIEEKVKEFENKFSPEWFKGFGTTDNIEKLYQKILCE